MTDNPENLPLYQETAYEPEHNRSVTPIRPAMKIARPADIARAADSLKELADPKRLAALPAPVAQHLAEALALLADVPALDPHIRPRLKIRPFIAQDPTTLPRREWVYPRLYVKKFMTVTISPGGLGKTGLALVEALAMVTGRDLLNDGFAGPPQRVWFWNGEDPYDELLLQVHAAMIHYNISEEDIGGRLFLDSGRDLEIKLARAAKGDTLLDRTIIAELVEEIRAREIDVAVFDPFVTIHAVPESSNDAIDQVATALAQIANDTNCAIGIVAHTRKLVPGAGAEVTADDNRGASALVNKARLARVLNRMTKEEADKAGIGEGEHMRFFRVGGDGNKQNLIPPSEDKTWRFNASVDLPNGPAGTPGDSIRVCTPWQWPDAFDDVSARHMNEFVSLLRHAPEGDAGWRKDPQSPTWAGKLLGQVLDYDADEVGVEPGSKSKRNPRITAKVNEILKRWLREGVIHEFEDLQPGQRKAKTYLAAGPGVSTRRSAALQDNGFREMSDE